MHQLLALPSWWVRSIYSYSWLVLFSVYRKDAIICVVVDANVRLPCFTKLRVTLVTLHHCASVLLAITKNDMNKPKNRESENVCHFSSVYTDSPAWLILPKKKRKKKRHPCVIHCECSLCPSRGHQSCQLLIFLRATKRTPVNVRERLSVCVCVFIGAGQFSLALSKLQLGAVWSAVISCREAETLKVTTAAPLMPVNVTEARTQSFL